MFLALVLLVLVYVFGYFTFSLITSQEVYFCSVFHSGYIYSHGFEGENSYIDIKGPK